MRYVDALKREVRLPSPPRRVVSLVPSLTEALFAFGVGGAVVGVTHFFREPPDAGGGSGAGRPRSAWWPGRDGPSPRSGSRARGGHRCAPSVPSGGTPG